GVVPGIIEFEGRQYSSMENIDELNSTDEEERTQKLEGLSVDDVCTNVKELKFQKPPALLLSPSIGRLATALDFLSCHTYPGCKSQSLGLPDILANASIEYLMRILQNMLRYITCRK